MKEKSRKVMGRPSKYDPSCCDVVIELMKDGASKIEVAAALDINPDTLYEWVKVHENFSDAVKRGEQLSEAWWQREGRTSLRDKNFNAVLWYMNMKNRFAWKDKVESNNVVTIRQEDALNELE